MNQRETLEYIRKLTEEEQNLYTKGNLTDAERKRMRDIDEELNQYWDFLRQRRALRNAGKNPEQAEIRDSGTIENYEQ